MCHLARPAIARPMPRAGTVRARGFAARGAAGERRGAPNRGPAAAGPGHRDGLPLQVRPTRTGARRGEISIDGLSLLFVEDGLSGKRRELATNGNGPQLTDLETEILDRRQLAVVRLRGIELGAHEDVALAAQIDVPRKPAPFAQAPRALLFALDLDEQRAAELSWTAEERVVGVDLVLDRRLVHDALDPQHLLNLVPDRCPVLEKKRQVSAQMNAAPSFDLHGHRAQRAAPVLVRRTVEDVGALHPAHRTFRYEHRLVAGHQTFASLLVRRPEALAAVGAGQQRHRVQRLLPGVLLDLHRRQRTVRD